MVYLFALIAIAVPDSQVAVPATQTISYHATAAECQTQKNFLEDKEYNRAYIRFDCVPLKVQ